MKKVLIILVIFLMAGFAGPLQAQQSVNKAERYAKLCLKKVKKHRFKKFQEYYPEAMKDINRIIANTTDKRFSHDRIADLGAKWIELMATLERFPNQKLAYKGSVITLNVKDYSAIYKKAKAIACKDHYLAGVATMNKYKDNYSLRVSAFPDFQKSLHYGNTYKKDIYQRGATIHYDEGLRIYNTSKSFSDKVKAEVPFEKALKWEDPFKNTRELMAKLYFDEASSLFSRVPAPNQAVALVLKNKNTWSHMGENLKNAATYFQKADKWLPNYKSCQAKENEVNTEAASILYRVGMKYAAIPSFQKQGIAAGFLSEVSQWEPGYKDAAEQAKRAKDRSNFIVVVAGIGGPPVKPSEINRALSGYQNMLNPDVSDKIYVNLNDPKNWPAAAKSLGRGFILVKLGNTRNLAANFHYKLLSPQVTTQQMVKYTQTVDGKETEVTRSQYNTEKAMLGAVGNRKVGASVHKYQGTLTKKVYQAELTGSIPLEIWDVRDPNNPILIKTLHIKKGITDQITRETYRGDPKAQPSLEYEGRNLKNKTELMAALHLFSISVPKLILNNKSYIVGEVGNDVKFKQNPLQAEGTSSSVSSASSNSSVMIPDKVYPGTTWKDRRYNQTILKSEDGRYSLKLQDDGNVVVYNESGRALWALGTDGQAVDDLSFQGDGNLVLYGPGGRVLWASGTVGADRLVLQDDGNLVIYQGNTARYASESDESKRR